MAIISIGDAMGRPGKVTVEMGAGIVMGFVKEDGLRKAHEFIKDCKERMGMDEG